MLQAGDEAPDFSLESDEGETVTLSALRGRPVVFYFYPKDDTPGCTAQACSLRDSYGEIAALGAALYGISPDDADSHRSFRAKFGCRSRCWSTRITRWPSSTTSGASARTARWASCAARSSSVPDGRLVRASYDVKPEDTTPEALAALSA